MRRKTRFLALMIGVVIYSTAYGDGFHPIVRVVPGLYPTIQHAIDASVDGQGDVIVVMLGVYFENINLKGKAVTLTSMAPDEPEMVAYTIIDGGGNGSVITCNSGEGPNTIINGFLIRNGSGTIERDYTYGGGMKNYESSPTVSNCIFSNNTADFGGGMENYNYSSPTITNCTFSDNTADYGGGMYNDDNSLPEISNCTFSGNTANYGGGMYNILDYSSILNPMVLSNCTFSANTATDNGGGNIAGGDGGGMYNIQSSFVILNDCTFSGNTATYKGGGISNSWYSELEISNCTFSDNTADFGGGISNCYNSLSTVNNSTFSANTATDNGGGIYNDAFEFYQSDLTVTDSYFCTNAPDQIHGLYTDDGMKNYMYCPDGPEYQGDFDGDGDVDMIDFAAFAANWLAGV